MFNNMTLDYFSKYIARKKTKAKSPKRKKSNEPLDDSELIIIDDDLEWNKEIEIEERRAYLEEARSQEAFD